MRRIDEWKLKLIDLSRRNRLIYFAPSKSSNINIVSPDMSTVFEKLVKGRGWKIWQPPAETIGGSVVGYVDRTYRPPPKNMLIGAEEDPKKLDNTLRNLSRRASSEYRERGVRILHLTMGMLRWREASSSDVIRSPIILLPVELVKERPHEPYLLRIPEVEEEAILNPALRLKIKNDHKIELTQLPDPEDLNLTEFFEKVAALGADLGWSVEPSVQLGLFSFYKLVMYQDLTENINSIAKHPIISALAGENGESLVRKNMPSEGDLDSFVEPANTYQVLDADGSQQLCIQYALGGQSFVMHGPPGTGKSQTIANIISEFISRGKSVLFVSEKMAALEVVYNRLKERGLDDFCLELHSQKANKRDVVTELSRALTEHLRPRRTMSEAELERLKNERDQLNGYVRSLHERRQPFEICAYDLLGNLAELEAVPYIASEYPLFDSMDPRKLYELEELAGRLVNLWKVIEEGDSFPWKGCMDPVFTAEIRADWINTLESGCSTIDQLEEESSRLVESLSLSQPKILADHELLKEVTYLLVSSPKPPSRWFRDADLGEVELEASKHQKEYDDYWSRRRSLERFYDNRIFKLPMGSSSELDLAWKGIKDVLALAPVEDGDGGLLKWMPELKVYLDIFPIRLQEWSETAAKLSQKLGLEEEVESISRVKDLAELARLCEEKNRPEGAWLDKETLKETKLIFEEARADYQQHEQLRVSLFENFSEELLKLDLDGLINWYEGPGKSIFRYFRPSFYRIRGQISRLNKFGKVPKTILEDLRRAKELVSLEHKMDSNREATRKSLSSYWRGGAPDFESAGRALEIAEHALRLIKSVKASKELINNLSVRSHADEEVLRLGRSLLDSLENWRSETKKLGELVPHKRLPDTGKSIQSSNIAEVEEWSVDASERLALLRNRGADALSTRITDHPATFQQLLSDVKEAEELQAFEASISEKAEELKHVFGGLFDWLTTDWGEILGAIEWTRKLRGLLRDEVPNAIVKAVSDEGVLNIRYPDLGSRLEKVYSTIDVVNRHFETPLWAEAKGLLDLGLVRKDLAHLRTRVDDLQIWIDFKETEKRMEELGLGGLLAKLMAQPFTRDQLLDIFHKSMYQGMINQIFSIDSRLKEFRGQDHEKLIADFQELDRKFIRLSAYRVIERANEQKPQGVFVQAPDSEITILQREAAKKRRHLSIRDLFDRMPNLLNRLKPCLLMSPISVSQFLIPDRLHFDMVVFDEASQIYSEDAVGAIYRGDQLVVAGDNKQLPPTPFFRYTLDEDFDWDDGTGYEFDVFDSVLDECMSIGLPVNMLRWHYRSKHDSLINFSNERFYDGRLVLFPSSVKSDENLGLKFMYVPNGVYDRGGARNNIKEADVVADLVFEHFEKHPEKSLGVVTFSLSQMNTVQDALDHRLTERPEFENFFIEDRLQGFFVKNLENVQGDERDVMIFSVGYGFDKEGHMTLNFGPLNKPGGERRLNVAITRAREKVILVSSIRHTDIDTSSTQAPGVLSLYNYLMYAEKGPSVLKMREAETDENPSPFEQDVLDEVEGFGFRAIPQVGSSIFRVDLGVLDPDDPDKFILGIMCDGENYISATTVRDRDRLRQQVLEGLGWRIHRIWSPDWVQRREAEMQRLSEALNGAVKSPRKQNVKVKDESPSSDRIRQVEVRETASSLLPDVEPYKLALLKPRRIPGKMNIRDRNRITQEYRSEVRYLLPTLVNAEGPIYADDAQRRISTSLGIRRSTTTLTRTYSDVVEELVRRGVLVVRDGFLWPMRSINLKVRTPIEGIGETYRPMHHIPQDELVAAMRIIASHTIGLGADSLMRETARLFGFKRMGENVRARLALALEATLRDGILVLENGKIRTA